MKRIILGAFAVVALTCGGIGLVTMVTGGDKKDATYEIPDSGPPVALTPKKVPPSPRPNTIREGIHRVGVDVKAGKYQTSGAIADALIVMCYWDVRKDSENGEIIAQGVKEDPEARGYVTLKSGQWFTTRGCENWTAVK